ncbi:hypothetical protein RJ55_06713 [Drechmeria coniospora]|nr:hypothetical protein RJ55_06713 [Drechmeria coniospora]
MASSYDSKSLFDVKDLVAVITGGGSGLGKIIAHALVANGAKAVYVLGRRQESLDATKESSARPQAVHPVVCDVTSKDSLQSAAGRVRDEVGYVNVLFANSGVITADVPVKDVDSLTVKSFQERLWAPSMEEFTRSAQVNVTGAFYTAVAFLDLLDEGNKRKVVPQSSQVIITSSAAGFARRPFAGFAYGTSKAAATHLAKQLGTVLSAFKIRVNTIAPGFYPSEMTDAMPFMKQTDVSKEGSLPRSFVPMERSGTAEDMAGAALFLVSRAGAYIAGNVLLTDGGRLGVVEASY